MTKAKSIRNAAAVASLASFLAGAQANAQQISFPRKTITPAAAEKIVNTCLEWYKTHPNPGKPAIWVLDANGNPIYMKRLDGTTKIGVETAKMKADSALYLFSPTRNFQNFVRPRPDGQPNLTGVVLLQLLNAYTSIGGLPIVVDGAVIGAVGVGGMVPDMARDIVPDEQCAQAGIDAVFPKK